MEIQDIIGYVVSIVSGLCVCIPLVCKLVAAVKDSIRKGNWDDVMKLVMGLMTEAERLFGTGSERKAWVLSVVKTSAANIDYPINDAAMVKIGDMIDKICDASKLINTTVVAGAATEK